MIFMVVVACLFALAGALMAKTADYWRRRAIAAELERERAIESRNRWRTMATRKRNAE